MRHTTTGQQHEARHSGAFCLEATASNMCPTQCPALTINVPTSLAQSLLWIFNRLCGVILDSRLSEADLHAEKIAVGLNNVAISRLRRYAKDAPRALGCTVVNGCSEGRDQRMSEHNEVGVLSQSPQCRPVRSLSAHPWTI